jgi:hypothetical protein
MLGHRNNLRQYPKKGLLHLPGILRLAARAGDFIAEALEDQAAIPATIVLGEDILDAAQIYSTAAGGAHEKKMAFWC